MKPIRLGILGFGSFARRRILPAARDLKEIQITCIQKRNVGEAQALAKEFNIPYFVTSREELIHHREVDAIFICTPNHMHEEDACAIALSKKPTICEKPLAPSSKAIRHMLKTFQENDTPFFVGHSLRFKPSVQQARAMIKKESLGKLLKIHVHLTLPLPKDNWRYKKEFSGGVLQDIGVHLVDLIHFLSEDSIVSVYAEGNHQEVDETVLALCKLGKGTLATLECSFEQPYRSGFEIVGEKSRLISLNSLRQTLDPIETLSQVFEDQSILYYPLKESNIYGEELKHFAEYIHKPEESWIPAEIALKNQVVIEALYQSLQEKRAIAIA